MANFKTIKLRKQQVKHQKSNMRMGMLERRGTLNKTANMKGEL